MPHRTEKTIVGHSRTVRCHQCGRLVEGVIELEYYRRENECLGCNHVRGEIEDAKRQESEEDEKLYSNI
jgi:hypothetical protein